MVTNPNLLLPKLYVYSALVGILIVILLVIFLSSRRVKSARVKAVNAESKRSEIEDEINRLRETFVIDKRSIENSTRLRVRTLDLNSKTLIYTHLLDHLERWKKGMDDELIIRKMIHDSADMLSRKVRDYWEKIETDQTNGDSDTSINLLENYLRRRIDVFEKALRDTDVEIDSDGVEDESDMTSDIHTE